ncbi:protein kinase [uncultured Bacteroides sp.]|uniref:protein kinase domain-containing protein n=1 Tax=uncultured Bacteroides sp. TaxID=162156 RepID=UPI00321F9893
MNDFQTLKMGTMLHNTYRVVRVLGQGGFGITYLAIHVRLKKKFAIKEFFPKSLCDRDTDTSHVRTASKANSVTVEKLKNKFIKEAEHIAEMDSPYIVRIVDVFEENHTAYYVMDYIEGRSLSDIVKNDGPIPVEKAVGYITKIGEALTYIHSKRMNHLDVKPANIMVRSKDNAPILIDFGLSKQYDSDGNQTSTTPVGISHGYAPMEQYNDGGVREFSPQTDIYSLGATLYFLLSGVTPPQATKLIEDELTFPSAIPRHLINPILKAMEPVRKSRYPSVSAFCHAITGTVAGDATTIDIPKPQPKPIPPKPQLQIPWKYIGSGVVAAIVVLLVFILTGSPAPDNPEAPIAEQTVNTVKDMVWNSPLGRAIYSGEVIPDSVYNSDAMIPHGKGHVEIIDGSYAGNKYVGQFVNGILEGETIYTLKNGDKFEGTFKNNEYFNGRYTFKDNGDYFVGSFMKGSPDKGVWYNKNGQII